MGCFYMTTLEPADCKVRTFGNEGRRTRTSRQDRARDKIKTRIEALGNAVVETSVGRVLLNDLFPKEVVPQRRHRHEAARRDHAYDG